MKSYRWKQNLNWLFDNLLKYICLSQDNVDWGEGAYRRESVGDRLVAVSGWYIYDISKGRWLFGDCSAAARRVVSDKLETENNHREWSDMSHQPVADLSSTSPRPSCDPPPPPPPPKKKKKKNNQQTKQTKNKQKNYLWSNWSQNGCTWSKKISLRMNRPWDIPAVFPLLRKEVTGRPQAMCD